MREVGFDREYLQLHINQIAGLRNRIVHGYDVIDLEQVYDIMKEDVPELESNLESIAYIQKKENNINDEPVGENKDEHTAVEQQEVRPCVEKTPAASEPPKKESVLAKLAQKQKLVDACKQ